MPCHAIRVHAGAPRLLAPTLASGPESFCRVRTNTASSDRSERFCASWRETEQWKTGKDSFRRAVGDAGGPDAFCHQSALDGGFPTKKAELCAKWAEKKKADDEHRRSSSSAAAAAVRPTSHLSPCLQPRLCGARWLSCPGWRTRERGHTAVRSREELRGLGRSGFLCERRVFLA